MARPRIRLFRKSAGAEAEPAVDERPEEKPSADDELLMRLQRMEWPKAPPELRERCWQEISRRISEMEGGGAKAGGEGQAQAGDGEAAGASAESALAEAEGEGAEGPDGPGAGSEPGSQAS